MGWRFRWEIEKDFGIFDEWCCAGWEGIGEFGYIIDK
jgi:hypothetical protein